MKIKYDKGHWTIHSNNWPSGGSYSIGEFSLWQALRQYYKMWRFHKEHPNGR